jgi:hypothetical protein
MRKTKQNPKVRGTIVATPLDDGNGCRGNGFFVIKTVDGGYHNLIGMGAPMGGKVGDKGWVQYQSGAGFGLYFWIPES